MSTPNFTWTPDVGAQQTIKPSVQQTKFGDGYELRTPIGVNYKPKRWQVTFTKNAVEATAILAFLEARGGLEAFTWTDPLDVSNTYVCREWNSSQQMFGIYQITASFEQIFEF